MTTKPPCPTCEELSRKLAVVRAELENIASAKIRDFHLEDDDHRYDAYENFYSWAQSRARHTLAAIQEETR